MGRLQSIRAALFAITSSLQLFIYVHPPSAHTAFLFLLFMNRFAPVLLLFYLLVWHHDVADWVFYS